MRFQVMLVALCLLFAFPSSLTAESKTLLTRIGEYQYPKAKLSGGATMADGATINSQGDRTVPSLYCSTVMTTPDDVEQVLAFYKSLLQPEPKEKKKASDSDERDDAAGRSVMFHENSKDRPVTLHVINVNEENVSTTIIISRVTGEKLTQIAWSQYERMPINR